MKKAIFEIWNHMRFDFRYRHWVILLAFLGIAFYLAFDNDFGTNQRLMPISPWAFAICVLVEVAFLSRSHKLVGDTPFWLTRPIGKTRLVLSKILCLLGFVLLWLAAESLRLILAGFDWWLVGLVQLEVIPFMLFLGVFFLFQSQFSKGSRDSFAAAVFCVGLLVASSSRGITHETTIRGRTGLTESLSHVLGVPVRSGDQDDSYKLMSKSFPFHSVRDRSFEIEGESGSSLYRAVRMGSVDELSSEGKRICDGSMNIHLASGFGPYYTFATVEEAIDFEVSFLWPRCSFNPAVGVLKIRGRERDFSVVIVVSDKKSPGRNLSFWLFHYIPFRFVDSPGKLETKGVNWKESGRYAVHLVRYDHVAWCPIILPKTTITPVFDEPKNQ